MFGDNVVDHLRRHSARHGGHSRPWTLEPYRPASDERGVQRRAADRFDAEDSSARIAGVHDRRDAGDEAAPANCDHVDVASGTSSSISSATVPWPATTSGSLKGWK